jgi:hypothetical protein
MLEKSRIVENSVEARQGFLDRPVLLVLSASLFLVIALFILVYALFFGTSG